MKTIKWKAIQVEVSKIKPTPNNFKIHTKDGKARFDTSVNSYGLAGAVVLNKDFTIIDGNSRVEKAKELGIKKIDASMPDRKLTPKEFTEFAAMYDLAKAGEVDVLRIKEELGDSKSWFAKWGFEMPAEALSKLSELEANESIITPTEIAKTKPAKVIDEATRITLLLTKDQAEEFTLISQSMYKMLEVDNVTDYSIAAARKLKKLI